MGITSNMQTQLACKGLHLWCPSPLRQSLVLSLQDTDQWHLLPWVLRFHRILSDSCPTKSPKELRPPQKKRSHVYWIASFTFQWRIRKKRWKTPPFSCRLVVLSGAFRGGGYSPIKVPSFHSPGACLQPCLGVCDQKGTHHQHSPPFQEKNTEKQRKKRIEKAYPSLANDDFIWCLIDFCSVSTTFPGEKSQDTSDIFNNLRRSLVKPAASEEFAPGVDLDASEWPPWVLIVRLFRMVHMWLNIFYDFRSYPNKNAGRWYIL